MSKFDLQEQEQISNLKYFWQKAGKYIVAIIVVALIGYAVYSWYSWRNETRSKEAANIYAAFTEAFYSNDKEKLLSLSEHLENDYPSTQYATMSSLLAAKSTRDSNDITNSTKLLNWVINNSKDDGMVSIARLRLADVYIDEKKFDKAIKLLQAKHDPVFDPLYYSKRGDLYVSEGQLDKARDSYKEALKKAGNDSNIAQGIQMRLEVLGNN